MKIVNATLFSLLLAVSTFAQANSNSDAAAPAGRSFRLLSTSGVVDDLMYDLNGRKTPVFSSSGALSMAYPCPATKSLVLYKEVQPPFSSPPGTKPTKQVVVEVDIPKQYHQSIILLAPLSEGAGALFQGTAFEDIPTEHTPGTFRLINLSSLSAALLLNQKTTQARPGESIIGRYELNEGILQIKIAVQQGSEWRQALGSERRMGSNMRALGVLINDKPAYEGALPISCCVVFDYLPLPPSHAP